MTSAEVQAPERVPAERASEPLRLGWIVLLIPGALLLLIGLPLVLRVTVVEAFEFEGPSACAATACSSRASSGRVRCR
jgi:hypothetical protein